MEPIKFILKHIFNNSVIYNFNLKYRDKFIQNQARCIPKESLVLDVGAGSCPYRKLFSHCQYKTQDFTGLSDDQLRYGGYGQIDYICDATQIPVNDNVFDVVLCTEVLEHLPNPAIAIKEFSRILKPGGKLILTAPLGSGIHQEPFHFYGGFTTFWYKKFLPENKFLILSIEPNCGSYKFFSQEGLRFIQMSNPVSIKIPMLIKILWLPLWLALLPFLLLIIPFSCHILDKYDSEKKFTVGYHVVAEKIETK